MKPHSKSAKNDQERLLPGSRIDAAKISIVIPAHNSNQVLSRAIDSVLRQSHQSFEIVIIDDAGDEDVGKLISTKYGSEERIRIHRHAVNRMAGGARNSGIEFSTGDFLFFLDADDRLLPGALELLVSQATSHDADVVQAGSVREYRRGHFEIYHAADFVSDGGIDGLKQFADHRFASLVWNKLYRMAFLRSSGICFEEKYMHEDIAFSAQAAFRAKRIVSVSVPIVEYVTNPGSLTHRPPTRTNLESYLATYISLIRLMQTFGLRCDKYRALALRIWNAHGTNDFGPKLIDCYSEMGPEVFTDELQSVASQQFGARGLAVGDIVVFFLGQIAQRDAALLAQNQGSLLRRLASQAQGQWLKRARAVRQMFNKVLGKSDASPGLFIDELLSAAWKEFGLAGLAVGDLVLFFFEQIARRDALLLQSQGQVTHRGVTQNHWNIAAQELLRQALDKARTPGRSNNNAQ